MLEEENRGKEASHHNIQAFLYYPIVASHLEGIYIYILKTQIKTEVKNTPAAVSLKL